MYWKLEPDPLKTTWLIKTTTLTHARAQPANWYLCVKDMYNSHSAKVFPHDPSLTPSQWYIKEA